MKSLNSSSRTFDALFCLQVGAKGKVIGIDHIKELVDDSISNVKKDDPSLITSGRVKLIGERIFHLSHCFLEHSDPNEAFSRASSQHLDTLFVKNAAISASGCFKDQIFAVQYRPLQLLLRIEEALTW